MWLPPSECTRGCSKRVDVLLLKAKELLLNMELQNYPAVINGLKPEGTLDVQGLYYI